MAVDSVRTDSTLSGTAPNPASSARLCSRQSADEAAQGGIARRPNQGEVEVSEQTRILE